ncbi:MAG: DUF2752 domain-containing protein [Bacteroidia bacterium]
MSAIDWLEHNLLTCPYKSMTGVDCPGCGMQRSFIELLRGNFFESLSLYPALIPILFTFIFLLFHLKFKFNNGAMILMYSFIGATTVVLVSFIIKMTH